MFYAILLIIISLYFSLCVCVYVCELGQESCLKFIIIITFIFHYQLNFLVKRSSFAWWHTYAHICCVQTGSKNTWWSPKFSWASYILYLPLINVLFIIMKNISTSIIAISSSNGRHILNKPTTMVIGTGAWWPLTSIIHEQHCLEILTKWDLFVQ